MGKRLLTPSHPRGDTRCPGEMSLRCPRAAAAAAGAAEQARPAALLLLSCFPAVRPRPVLGEHRPPTAQGDLGEQLPPRQ